MAKTNGETNGANGTNGAQNGNPDDDDMTDI